jgi:hypothetical protein
MTLTEARAYLARLTRSGADDGRYTATDYDLALADVGHKFCRDTRIVRAAATCTVADGDGTVTGFGSITGFRPERLISARVRDTDAEDDLIITSARTIANKTAEDATEGIPTHLGFSTHVLAEVWPVPDAAYTIDVYTWTPFVSFTPGTATPGSVTINIPDDLVYDVLRFAADYAMRTQITDRQMFFAAQGAFAQFIRETKGRGSVAGQLAIRDASELED